MIILSGNRTSLTKEKHNLIESVCKKYDFYPDILEITSVESLRNLFDHRGDRNPFTVCQLSHLYDRSLPRRTNRRNTPVLLIKTAFHTQPIKQDRTSIEKFSVNPLFQKHKSTFAEYLLQSHRMYYICDMKSATIIDREFGEITLLERSTARHLIFRIRYGSLSITHPRHTRIDAIQQCIEENGTIYANYSDEPKVVSCNRAILSIPVRSSS